MLFTQCSSLSTALDAWHEKGTDGAHKDFTLGAVGFEEGALAGT